MASKDRWDVGRFATLLAFVVLLLCPVGVEAATTPELLWRAPEDGLSGSAGGRLQAPQEVAVDPLGGHVFVADAGNGRIDEFDPWGQFIKTWGWGVVASGPDNAPPKNERQEFDVTGLGGSYKIAYINAFSAQNGESVEQTTSAISLSASAATVQAALEGLESLMPGDVEVQGPAGGPYTVEFLGRYADSDIPPLKAVGDTTATAVTLQGGGTFEICVPENGDICQAGQKGGNEPGQVPEPIGGIAVGAGGRLYVQEITEGRFGEEKSLRVQEFNLQGEFLAMWGGEVNKTTGANLCTKADVSNGDVCGSGVPGTGSGEFQITPQGRFGGGISVGPEGNVFVADIERIQKFGPDGEDLPDIPVPGVMIGALVVDSEGDFYVTSLENNNEGVKPGILKLDSSGNQLETLAPELRQVRELALAVDDGLYASGRLSPFDPLSIFKFSPTGSEEFGAGTLVGALASIRGLATSSACGIQGEDVYESGVGDGETVLRAYGPPPDPAVCPPPVKPPAIIDQYASAVTTEEAVVRASINPKFWPDTRYRVEYGNGKCSEGGCTLVEPGEPGFALGEKVVGAPELTGGVTLPGLVPATTYHYRFVAESSGGGPVFGIDPDGSGPQEATLEDGLEGSFTTFPSPLVEGGCPNAAFRSGLSARLRNCRAYEMVTPVDKGNSDAIALLAEPENRTRAALNQSSLDGEKLTYGTYRAFGDSLSAPYGSQYLATRTSSGWASHAISPPRGHLLVLSQLVADSQFKAFSPDLCMAWVFQETDTLLAPGAVPGFPNMYRRQNCGGEAGSYQALTTAAPPNYPVEEYIPELQGFSADGTHALIESRDSLTGTPYLGLSGRLLFEAYGAGQLRLVCILPNGQPVSTSCSAGTFSSAYEHGRTEAVSHAISADGSRIFWSDAGIQEGQGKIYVRIKGKQTLAVSQEAEELTGNDQSQYWTAAADGSRAIFTVGRIPGESGEEESFLKGEADLYEYDVDGKATTLIAQGVFGVLGASEDARRIYFVSQEALAAAAIPGKPNLYLHEAGNGDFTYIATLSSEDVRPGTNTTYSPINSEPPKHTAQVTPDGLQAVFMSTAPLTGVDSTDAASGQADAQVYRFDATTGGLDCVSCSPTGARPVGRNLGNANAPMWAAARLPLIQSEIYPISRAISSNGTRVFFESFQPLVPTDVNGAQDVYEWEAPGTAGCADGGPFFSTTAGGCVSLISAGEGEADSEITDTDPSGDNVFFVTQASLVAQDPGLFDIYDARVNGGFPSPPPPPSPCDGEACQPGGEAPNDPAPASSTFNGPGNLTPKSHKHKHKKKKHRKHRKHRRGHHHKRGGSR